MDGSLLALARGALSLVHPAMKSTIPARTQQYVGHAAREYYGGQHQYTPLDDQCGREDHFPYLGHGAPVGAVDVSVTLAGFFEGDRATYVPPRQNRSVHR